MSATLIALFVSLLPAPQGATTPSTSMEADVNRLVRAAEKLTSAWPSQAPPPIPEVSLVARHGIRVAPLLTALLSDDPSVERVRKRWKCSSRRRSPFVASTRSQSTVAAPTATATRPSGSVASRMGG